MAEAAALYNAPHGDFSTTAAAGDEAGLPPGARGGADAETPAPVPLQASPPGAARAQLHATYIVAQTPAGLVIADQNDRKTGVEGKRVSVRVALVGGRTIKKKKKIHQK